MVLIDFMVLVKVVLGWGLVDLLVVWMMSLVRFLRLVGLVYRGVFNLIFIVMMCWLGIGMCIIVRLVGRVLMRYCGKDYGELGCMVG